MIAQFNKTYKGLCTVKTETVKAPMPGTKLTFSYDASKVIIDYFPLKSADFRNGVTFVLYDRSLLQRLNNKEHEAIVNA